MRLFGRTDETRLKRKGTTTTYDDGGGALYNGSSSSSRCVQCRAFVARKASDGPIACTDHLISVVRSFARFARHFKMAAAQQYVT